MTLRIFISYTSKDRAYVEELKKFLASYIRHGQVTLWEDHRIQPGKSWATEIGSALQECNIAILLVSQDFLASDYINDVEIPKLLERAHRGAVTIAPIFLSPAVLNNHRFPVRIASGKTKQKTLADFQGFKKQGNTPDNTLKEVGEKKGDGARSRVLKDIAEAIPGLAPPNRSSKAPKRAGTKDKNSFNGNNRKPPDNVNAKPAGSNTPKTPITNHPRPPGNTDSNRHDNRPGAPNNSAPKTIENQQVPKPKQQPNKASTRSRHGYQEVPNSRSPQKTSQNTNRDQNQKQQPTSKTPGKHGSKNPRRSANTNSNPKQQTPPPNNVNPKHPK